MVKVYDIESGELAYEIVDTSKEPKGPCPVSCEHCGGPMAITEGGFICMDCGKVMRRPGGNMCDK